MELSQKKQLLVEAFQRLPQDDYSLSRFGKAYLYRRQFEYLAEYGNDGDDSGLVTAVSTALNLSVGFEIGNIYADSGRGVERIPAQFLSGNWPRDFKQEVCAAVSNLSDYTVKIFFESLEWIQLEYQNPANLEWAVGESLHNYARVATFGIDSSPPEVTPYLPAPKRSKRRKNQPETLRSPEFVADDGKTDTDKGKFAAE